MKTTKQRRKERIDALFRRNFHSVKRMQWIRRQFCFVTGRTPSVNAHTRTRGSGGGYRNIVPLHQTVHLDFDYAMDDEKFRATYGLTKQSVKDAAPIYQELWEEHDEI